jgi:hypothetical protein
MLRQLQTFRGETIQVRRLRTLLWLSLVLATEVPGLTAFAATGGRASRRVAGRHGVSRVASTGQAIFTCSLA